MKNAEGNKVPQVTFRSRKGGDWVDLTTEQLFAGKRVVVFSLPGAYTPTCSSSHLPRYEDLTPTLKQNGIDDVYCLSVNDGFVMEAWGQAQGIKNVRLIPDGNGEFVEKLGFLVDKSDLGFGKRSWRFSMVVDDGVVEKMFIEEETPGDPFEVSDADTMLNYINPSATPPSVATIFTKPGCPFCEKAKALFGERGIPFEEVVLDGGLTYNTLRNVTGRDSTPQAYLDGVHIDGLDGLVAHFARVDER